MLPAAWLGIGVVVGALLGASLLVAWWVNRSEAASLANYLEARFSRGEVQVGAVFIGIDEKNSAQVIREALAVARTEKRPDGILQVWQRAGGRVVAHVPGAGVRTSDDAREWLRRKVDEFEKESFPRARPGEALFGLLYAGIRLPSTRVEHLEHVRRLLGRGRCIGVAFVTCKMLPVAVTGMDATKRWLFRLALTIPALATLGLLFVAWVAGLSNETFVAPPTTSSELAPRNTTEAGIDAGALEAGSAAVVSGSAIAEAADAASEDAADDVDPAPADDGSNETDPDADVRQHEGEDAGLSASSASEDAAAPDAEQSTDAGGGKGTGTNGNGAGTTKKSLPVKAGGPPLRANVPAVTKKTVQ